MAINSRELLAADDWVRRSLHGVLILLAIISAILVPLLFSRSQVVAGWIAFAAFWALLFTAGAIRQCWQVGYRGHEIRFESGPLYGQKLYVDGDLAARNSGFGLRSELRAAIPGAEAAGDQVVVRCVKRFDHLVPHFHCRITVEPIA